MRGHKCTLEYFISMWSRGIRTWSSWRNPLSIPKPPNLGPMSPTLTPVGIETDSQLKNFNLLSCATVINGEVVLQPPPQFVPGRGVWSSRLLICMMKGCIPWSTPFVIRRASTTAWVAVCPTVESVKVYRIM